MNIRRHGRRFAWLMIGAAIGTTVVLVLGLGIPLGAESRTSPVVLLVGVAGAVLLGGLLGLVPGVRELEVTGARSMLGVETELVVPRRPGLIHRVQDVAWVQLHLLLGMLAASCLTMLLPASTVLALESLQGGPGTVLPIPASVTGRIAAAGLGLLGMVAALGAAAPFGALAAHLAPRLLGPTARDRLEVALARAAREADRIRIARDLHDGIGHALTIVSIQAAAGGRVLERDRDAAGRAFDRIEATTRGALEELDVVLAQLRDEQGADGAGRATSAGQAPSAPDPAGPGLAGPDPAGPDPDRPVASDFDRSGLRRRLEHVAEDHRAAGMELHEQFHLPAGLPQLQREHLVRVVGELLTNAHRHGAAGPVHLTIRAAAGPSGEPATALTVENPLPVQEAVDPAGDDPGGDDPAGRDSAGGDSAGSDPAGRDPVGRDSAGRDPAGSDPAGRDSASSRGGRGLAGLREQLELWGGTLEAGPRDGTWRARALVPTLTERTEP